MGRGVHGPPFGNRTVIETLTGARCRRRSLNGFSAFCDPAINTGRFPQVSGLKVQFHCDAPRAAGRRRDLEGAERAWRDADAVGPTRHAPASSRTTSCSHGRRRLRRLLAGHRRPAPGDDLMQVTIDYITAHSPVSAAVEGRSRRAVAAPRPEASAERRPRGRRSNSSAGPSGRPSPMVTGAHTSFYGLVAAGTISLRWSVVIHRPGVTPSRNVPADAPG